MAKVWVLDTDTKGTGAYAVPLEKALKQPAPNTERVVRAAKSRARSRSAPEANSAAAPEEPAKSKSRRERRSGPLPPGHVRKKSTGEIGRVRSVDPKTGTASVLWLRQGRTSTVPLTAISRR